MTLRKLGDYKNRETIEAIEGLLKDAKAGLITGFMFCTERGHKVFSGGATGEFLEDPLIAVAATARMQYLFNREADAIEGKQKLAFRTTSF